MREAAAGEWVERQIEMRSRSTAEEQREVIIRGTQHLVATGGMNNFSFPKLMAETGINPPAVYELYKNKEDLLTSCYLRIDTEIGKLLSAVLKQSPPHRDELEAIGNYCWILWSAYWNYLVTDAERTQFYWAFYHSEYYTKELAAKHQKNFNVFLAFVEELDQRFHVSAHHNKSALVTNLIDGTISGAIKVLRGEYEDSYITVHTIYRIVFQPVFLALGIDPATLN